jgi:hypothetical protein
MIRGRWIGVLLAIFIMVYGHTAWAQTTGSIRGRTVDTDGQTLPGVTIVVTGEVLGSAQRTAVTSASGGFMFAAVPIGTYTVTAVLDGFQKQAAEGVRVAIGAVATVDFTMPEAFSDEITVVAETPIVDTASPTFNSRFEFDEIVDLPTRGNFYDIIAVTPGMSQMSEGSSWVAAFGSDVKSSQWNIDGLNRTAPEGGDLSWSMNDELVAEVQVLGTGATAEYGGMLGTAFNVVTKSGTNQFHGSANLDYWNPNWVAENGRREDAPEGAQTYRLDHHNNLALTLGGPIVKDTLWFFAGAEFGRVQAFNPFEDSTLEAQKETTWDNFDLKLTSQLAQNHRLNVTAASHEYLGPNAGDVFSEPSAWGENWNHDKMVAVDYSAILGPNTVFEARAGAWRGDNEWRSQYPSGEPTFVDRTVYPWRYYGDVWWTWEWEQHADDAEVIITQHADDFIKGDHEFRFGVQYSRGGGTTKTFNPDYFYQAEYESYYYPGYYYTYQYWYTGLPYYYGGESESVGAFVTDSWTIGSNLTLDIGVRYDRNKGWIPDFNRLDMDSNPTGEVIPGRDMVNWNSVDPRFGFAWQPTGNGTTVLRGSIGLFHAGMTSGDWYSPPPDVAPWGTYWLNWDNAWELLWVWESTPDTFLIPGTENAHTWEYTLGFEHQLTATSAIGVQAVYKRTKNQIGWYIADDGEFEWFTWVDPETGIEYSVEPTRYKGNSTGPGAVGGDRPYEQDYQGFFLTYKKRFSNNWDLMASYSYSRSEGLNPRFITTDWSGQGSVFYANRAEADPNAFINADKMLAGDRRHVLRLVGNVVLPLDFKISSVVNIQSGRTYDRSQWVHLPSRSWSEIITSPASDSQRLQTQYLWDLGVGKHFNLGRGTDLSVDIQVLNILNDDAVEWWRDANWPAGEEPLPGGWVLPRRAEVRARFSF